MPGAACVGDIWQYGGGQRDYAANARVALLA